MRKTLPTPELILWSKLQYKQLDGILPKEEKPGRMDGDENILLKNCRRYIHRQQCLQHGCRRKGS